MDRYILGTAALGGVYGTVDPATSVRTILRALEQGFTAIDTAPAYGDAETYVGRALKEWKGSKPIVSTKVGRLRSYASDTGHYDYSSDTMERSVGASLTLLGLPKLDILFLHDPWAIPPGGVEAAIGEMQRLKLKGYTERIGLGGNPPPSLWPYIEAGVFDVVMEFGRLTAICQDALTQSIPKYLSLGILPYMASPLYLGLLGRRFEEFSLHKPAWLDSVQIQKAAEVNRVAQHHGLSLSSLAHRYVFFAPANMKIVIGPGNLTELEETWTDILSGPLPPSITDAISLISQKAV
ncbi:MAG TPA: aldo/keto reductase [Puia sp.]|nr:aldo/keto reductase [Puia sp.]